MYLSAVLSDVRSMASSAFFRESFSPCGREPGGVGMEGREPQDRA
jgi:hypothetical protein